MRSRRFFLYLAFAAGLAGCSSGDSGTTPPSQTAGDLTSKGWKAYSAKSYTTALSDFSQALALDNSYSDAYNGEGWSYARLGNPDSALTAFTAGRSRDAASADMRAGAAFVYNALKSYTLSLEQDTALLRISPSWKFSHDTAVNYLDLHLLAAENYFALENFTASLAEVQFLNPSFGNPDVNTIAGQILLAREIERLGTFI